MKNTWPTINMAAFRHFSRNRRIQADWARWFFIYLNILKGRNYYKEWNENEWFFHYCNYFVKFLLFSTIWDRRNYNETSIIFQRLYFTRLTKTVMCTQLFGLDILYYRVMKLQCWVKNVDILSLQKYLVHKTNKYIEKYFNFKEITIIWLKYFMFCVPPIYYNAF